MYIYFFFVQEFFVGWDPRIFRRPLLPSPLACATGRGAIRTVGLLSPVLPEEVSLKPRSSLWRLRGGRGPSRPLRPPFGGSPSAGPECCAPPRPRAGRGEEPLRPYKCEDCRRRRPPPSPQRPPTRRRSEREACAERHASHPRGADVAGGPAAPPSTGCPRPGASESGAGSRERLPPRRGSVGGRVPESARPLAF